MAAEIWVALVEHGLGCEGHTDLQQGLPGFQLRRPLHQGPVVAVTDDDKVDGFTQHLLPVLEARSSPSVFQGHCRVWIPRVSVLYPFSGKQGGHPHPAALLLSLQPLASQHLQPVPPSSQGTVS